ncbi:nuclear receptor subfamily 2 group E member 1-like [Coccinella septempunctata]|uniref:nuclear receptor subfamily 2 group E member 1-like n=1 Tax=Coccinella septempunctata TaxID=41139 RepID=UPI001D05EF1E|nr:nuclear receptor subfamily 2 group E member 1-like [Coccinella septempunctata]
MIKVEEEEEKMDESNHSSNTETLCKVCGDKASGKHYGVASCDGCRGFFKRSIRRNLEYICKENGCCVVDVTRRNQCQACRFKKCLQVNMKRDAVQHERAPRSVQGGLHYPLSFGGRLRGIHSSPIFGAMPLHLQVPTVSDPFPPLFTTNPSGPYFHQSLLHPNFISSFSKPTTILTGNLSFSPPYSMKQSTNINGLHRIVMKEDEVSSSEEGLEKNTDENQQFRSRLEIPILNDVSRNNTRLSETPNLTLFPAENIYESAAKLLFLAIKWARTIPSFLQLSYRDQTILLEESWSELFVLTASQWALNLDETVLISNAMAPSSRHSALEEDARKLREVINRLTVLRLDHTEHACLKALVLFKADCRGLCEPSHIELLQDQTHMMLQEYCSQRHNVTKGRFGKLLLTLPAVQSVPKRGLEELLFRQTVGDVAIDRLLADLAKNTQSH